MAIENTQPIQDTSSLDRKQLIEAAQNLPDLMEAIDSAEGEASIEERKLTLDLFVDHFLAKNPEFNSNTGKFETNFLGQRIDFDTNGNFFDTKAIGKTHLRRLEKLGITDDEIVGALNAKLGITPDLGWGEAAAAPMGANVNYQAGEVDSNIEETVPLHMGPNNRGGKRRTGEAEEVNLPEIDSGGFARNRVNSLEAKEKSRSQVREVLSELHTEYLAQPFQITEDNILLVKGDISYAETVLAEHNTAFPNDTLPDRNIRLVQEKIDAYNESVVQAEPATEEMETTEEISRSDVREAVSNLHTKYLANNTEITSANYNEIRNSFLNAVNVVEEYNINNPDNEFPTTILFNLGRKLDAYNDSLNQNQAQEETEVETETQEGISRSEVRSILSDLHNDYLAGVIELTSENIHQAEAQYRGAIDFWQNYNFHNPENTFPSTILDQMRDKLDSYYNSIEDTDDIVEVEPEQALEPIPADVFDTPVEPEAPAEIVEPAATRITEAGENEQTTTFTEPYKPTWTKDTGTMTPIRDGEGEVVTQKDREELGVIENEPLEGFDINEIRNDFLKEQEFFKAALGDTVYGNGVYFEDYDNPTQKNGKLYYKANQLDLDGRPQIFYIALDGEQLS